MSAVWSKEMDAYRLRRTSTTVLPRFGGKRSSCIREERNPQSEYATDSKIPTHLHILHLLRQPQTILLGLEPLSQQILQDAISTLLGLLTTLALALNVKLNLRFRPAASDGKDGPVI